ncbi:YceD family protein [Streptomyces aculeolatus]|uniref:YceD family protein n=1 Tax=Streptomyces aculeolatus TaxID=270689 RepID=UPI00055AD376|nr:YceD family protein [Streptomyces aculeolatus]
MRRVHESRKALKAHPDHRAPLVFDTRDLGRRPGTLKRLTRTVPAPKDLGNEVVGVPEGDPVELELRLESVMEGVLVTGTARARATGECVRCLEPLGQELRVDIQELYSYPETDARGRVARGGGSGADAEEADAEEEALYLEDDMFDLEPELRDAVVLALPLQPVCREDCPGLCPDCGARLADDPDHRHDVVDARWAALQGLAETVSDGEKNDTSGADDGAGEKQEK